MVLKNNLQYLLESMDKLAYSLEIETKLDSIPSIERCFRDAEMLHLDVNKLH